MPWSVMAMADVAPGDGLLHRFPVSVRPSMVEYGGVQMQLHPLFPDTVVLPGGRFGMPSAMAKGPQLQLIGEFANHGAYPESAGICPL